MPLPDLLKIVRKNISKTQRNAMMNGVICLKGGNVEAEVQPYRRIVEVSDISQWFTEEWFREKNVIYLPLS
jgi:16S rRNA (guanine527-N7)-methyltransferase